MANEFVDKETLEKEAQKKKKKREKRIKTKRENGFVKSLLQVVNGDVLTREFVIKNLPFLMFLSLVMVAYIGYGYHVQKVAKDIIQLENEIRELNTEEVTLTTDLNQVSRQENIAKKLKKRGVKESEDPIKKIEVTKDSE